MKKEDLEGLLFRRGWLDPTGLHGRHLVFEVPDQKAAPLHVNQTVIYPVSAIVHGGFVDQRLLLTSELGRGIEGYDLCAVAMQRRNENGQWMTDSLHTPARFEFAVSSEPSFLGIESGEVLAFMKLAQGHGLTRCFAQETEFGKITLRPQNAENDFSLLQLDARDEAPKVRVLQRGPRQFHADGWRYSVIRNDETWPAAALDELERPEVSSGISASLKAAKNRPDSCNNIISRVRRWMALD